MVEAEEGDDVVMGREGQGFGLADGGAAEAGEGKPAAADFGHPDSMRDSETERVVEVAVGDTQCAGGEYGGGELWKEI